MRPLIKIALLLIAGFASTFIFVKITGLITLAKIENWLDMAESISPVYAGLTVMALLFADLFIAIPTLTITILSGYFLGPTLGAMAAISGMAMASLCGYAISHRFGPIVLQKILKDPAKCEDVKNTFHKHGFVMIMLARAAPILPEVTACLAGLTRMPITKFIMAWSISTVPYVLIAAYAGSVSTLNNPKPAIFTAIGMTLVLWVLLFFFRRKKGGV